MSFARWKLYLLRVLLLCTNLLFVDIFQFGPRSMTGRELIAEHTIVLFRLSLNAIAGVFP